MNKVRMMTTAAAALACLAAAGVATSGSGQAPPADHFESAAPEATEAGLAMSQFGHVATPIGLSMLGMNRTEGPVATPVGLSMLGMNRTEGPVATPVGLSMLAMNATAEPVLS